MPCMDEHGLLEMLFREVRKHGNQRNAAVALGISQQFLNDVLKRRRGPGDKLLKALGLEKRVEFVRVK